MVTLQLMSKSDLAPVGAFNYIHLSLILIRSKETGATTFCFIFENKILYITFLSETQCHASLTICELFRICRLRFS